MSSTNANANLRAMLRSISLFARLDDAHLASLTERFVTLKAPPGERVLMQGEKIDRFVVVLSGALNVLRSSADGRERIVTTLRPGMHFGLAEMITGRGAEAAIRAEKPSILAVISRKAFHKLVLGNPELCYALMQTMARSIFTLSRQLDSATFDSAENRILRRLLALAGASGVRCDEGVRIVPAPTHQDLAAMVGSARETVSRVLGELKNQGLVRTGYRRLTLVDTAELRRRLEESA